jgi:hypothetical protein
MKVLTVGLVALSLACVGNARAGSLAPSKPSQLVTLNSSGATCTGGESKLDTQVNGDATSAAFTIPAGMVLVLTGIDWNGTALSAGATSVFLDLRTASAFELVSLGGAVTQNPSGQGGGTFGPLNIVVKPGTDICVGLNGGGSIFPAGHGFLAKDR